MLSSFLPYSVLVALSLVFQILWFVILAHVIMSWLIGFNVLNMRQPLVYKLWDLLTRALEPFYGPIRRILPPMQGIDLTPMIVIIALIFIQRLLGI
ncbi:YggT family protein [Rhodobacter aestuarii]|uniref:YggT family protein n=1 Tax=Rhodobacter aestuarii TaxID=453582 RepID=A0A1N7LNI8_9RHOB|nr:MULTISPECIES: YggT family protein [Rhodobacter]PTV95139.1 YggT family protein [Rhodobacter aestuarii]SIS75352.1 YggT family protein [Rhodobacter aestuarii]SOC07492.1 YggT family protein [Rhodobacter sp. JA431]